MKKKIYIEGMSCMHCVKHVKDALSEIGIGDVEVDLNSKIATIDFDNDLIDNEIKAAIEDAGYDVIRIESI